MNIIRTITLELESIPAIAYKYKLRTGGSGIKLYRLDSSEIAVATIDKRTGSAIPYGKVDTSLFPEIAFEEAVELFAGMPYSSRGNVKLSDIKEKVSEEIAEEEVTTEQLADMTNSDEYIAIVDMYTDEKGRLNYKLMNKQFIQFANKSKTVANMVDQRVDVDDIIMHVVKNRASHLANKKENLSDEDVKALINTLDEISPKSAFKDLKLHINRMYSK